MASDMTSHNLSGWDSVTDSDVKRKVLLSALLSSSKDDDVVAVVVLSAAEGLVGESPGAPSPIAMSVGLFIEDAPSPAPSADADAVPTLAVVDIILIVEGKKSVGYNYRGLRIESGLLKQSAKISARFFARDPRTNTL